jgi:hypothetical protein
VKRPILFHPAFSLEFHTDAKVLPMRECRAAATVRRLRWVFLGLVATWLACETAAWIGYSESPLHLAWVNLLTLPHLPIAFGGMVVFYFFSQPGSAESLRMLALGCLLALGLKLLDPVGGWATPAPYCLCFGLGTASLVLMGLRVLRLGGDERQQVLAVLLTAGLVLGTIPLIFYFLILTVQLRPQTFDALAYAADGALGVQLSFLLGRVFAAVPGLAPVSILVYCTLPVAFMVLLVLSVRGYGPPVEELLPSFLCVAVCGFLIYLIFPLTGPLFAFANVYPDAPPPTEQVLASALTVPEVPRNCMPSLHTAWALLLWFHARRLGRWLCLGASVFLGFTMLATLGFGAHYAFDVVVAFPSTLACRALGQQTPAIVTPLRHRAAIWGVLMTASWLMLLRHGYWLLAISPWITASVALATMAFAIWLERTFQSDAEQIALA